MGGIVTGDLAPMSERLAIVRQRVADAAKRSGRSAGNVQIVAVSKFHPVEAVREAVACGQRVFGENYAQNLEKRRVDLADLPTLEWHFIGHLQTNKAKLIAQSADVVETLDNVSVVRALAKRLEWVDEQAGEVVRARMKVLIEVNVAAEPQKHGASPVDLAELIDAVLAEKTLDLRGLMTIGPNGSLDDARRVFESLATIRNLHQRMAPLPELSMGMSSDLEAAIECGSTMVRVGTAIFGDRPAKDEA